MTEPEVVEKHGSWKDLAKAVVGLVWQLVWGSVNVIFTSLLISLTLVPIAFCVWLYTEMALRPYEVSVTFWSVWGTLSAVVFLVRMFKTKVVEPD